MVRAQASCNLVKGLRMAVEVKKLMAMTMIFLGHLDADGS